MATILDWLAPALMLAWVALAFGIALVQGTIRPLLIPRATITRLAQDLIRRYPDDPLLAAEIEEHAAWYRSEMYERGMWRRVRREVGRQSERAIQE